jgi:hypothetical protein
MSVTSGVGRSATTFAPDTVPDSASSAASCRYCTGSTSTGSIGSARCSSHISWEAVHVLFWR